jgi:hypothetical protein
VEREGVPDRIGVDLRDRLTVNRDRATHGTVGESYCLIVTVTSE